MLFSNEGIAQFINNSFEPAWESVRPVPIVRIDFGNGNIITRTLHGNIASYVCSADGKVLDILPGIYDPAGYRDALDQLRILARNISLMGEEQRKAYLAGYHRDRAATLKKGQDPARLVEMRLVPPVGKAIVERPLENLVAAKRLLEAAAAEAAPAVPAEDLASWKALAEDTRLNEKARRQLIHEQLGAAGAVKPEAVKKWLYKEVLHADLDDPYLGLGKALFAGYPFAGEDK